MKQALVVESRFARRKALMEAITANDIADEVIEAKSVSDGFRHLKSTEIDACVLGPTLSQGIAVEFVSRARHSLKNPACAFIAVVDPGRADLANLRASGIDSSLVIPYSPQVFTSACRLAQASARRRASRSSGAVMATGYQLKMTPVSLHRARPQTAAEAISAVVEGLRDVAARIGAGELRLQRSGKPSLATLDALRLALEAGFPESSLPTEIGTIDHLFVTELVRWFSNRVSTSADQALAALGDELQAFHTARIEAQNRLDS